jgi:hypothetical protein
MFQYAGVVPAKRRKCFDEGYGGRILHKIPSRAVNT